MKKFLVLIVLFLGIIISVNAQVQTYRTTGYYEKKLYSWGWGNWSSKQQSNMNIVINLNTDVVTIYSPRTQVYRIYEYSGTTKDGDGDVTATFYFYDQDNDRGTMRLVIRANGQSQLYIDFANIMWAYDVYKTN